MLIKTSIFIVIFILSNVEGQRRIFGGHVAEPGQIPYAVYLDIRGRGSCTGSIVHTDWVLTAAHCVSLINGDVVSAQRVKITAGAVHYTILNQLTEIRHGQDIVRHRKYEPGVGYHDVSLIKVDKPFIYNKYVKKIEFMNKPWPQNKEHIFENCMAAGWGYTKDSKKPNEINYMNTSARHGLGTCPCIDLVFKLRRIVCLPKEAGKGVCFGDSGGSLACDGKIVGVAHVVLDSRSCSAWKSPDDKINCGNKEVYGIYMYTCPYLKWISKYVPEVPEKPASCIGVINFKPSEMLQILINIIILILLK